MLSNPIAREVTLLLALKTVAIVALLLLFFGPSPNTESALDDLQVSEVGDSSRAHRLRP